MITPWHSSLIKHNCVDVLNALVQIVKKVCLIFLWIDVKIQNKETRQTGSQETQWLVASDWTAQHEYRRCTFIIISYLMRNPEPFLLDHPSPHILGQWKLGAQDINHRWTVNVSPVNHLDVLFQLVMHQSAKYKRMFFLHCMKYWCPKQQIVCINFRFTWQTVRYFKYFIFLAKVLHFKSCLLTETTATDDNYKRMKFSSLWTELTFKFPLWLKLRLCHIILVKCYCLLYIHIWASDIPYNGTTYLWETIITSLISPW